MLLYDGINRFSDVGGDCVYVARGIDNNDVFAVLEDVLPPIFAKYGTYDIASKAPFTRIPYLEAMEKYGSDKPDLRIDLVVQDITALVQGTEFAPFAPGNVIKAVAVSGCEMTRKQIDKLCADVEVQAGNKPYWFKVEGNGEFVGGISKFLNDRKDSITEALGLKPGAAVGETLSRLLDLVLDEEVPNEKGALLAAARKEMQTHE